MTAPGNIAEELCLFAFSRTGGIVKCLLTQKKKPNTVGSVFFYYTLRFVCNVEKRFIIKNVLIIPLKKLKH